MRPTSTYRLQLHAGFKFQDALALVDYLDALGIGAAYLSPILRAEAGSMHGYDVVDPTVVSPELGGEEAFIALAEALHARKMQVVVDFVPNHMGIASSANAWWQDVLENGPSSRYAEFFDIDWGQGRVLLPILGDSYGAVLERQELKVVRDGGVLSLRYFDHRMPLAPRSLSPLIERASDDVEMLSIATALRNLPDKDETDDARREERAREKEVAKRRLAQAPSDALAALDRAIEALNASADALDDLLSHQAYRLSHWRVAGEAINYRRFFDVNTLAAVRMEEPKVFAKMHEKLFDLCARGFIDGIRLDHTDGLRDPTHYFALLRERVPGAWIVAEKILEPGERLPKAWAIDGTTGYDYASAATGVLCDPRAEPVLDAFARRFTGLPASFEEWVVRSKRLVLQQSLASEVSMLTRRLAREAEANRRYRDITLGVLQAAIVEVIACFPVYRTYAREDGTRQPQDDAHIERALVHAMRLNPAMSALPFRFLHEVLKGSSDWVLRFQQLTGPAMAKSVEDTAFYTFNRFIACNEVGNDPSHIGLSLEAYHSQNAARCSEWPNAMIATATHDTKHGEDARARLAVLSEMPDAWRKHVTRWSRMAPKIRPTKNDEYLFYQALLSAMPYTPSDDLADRMSAYMLKAAKEAKLSTSWVNPNEDYERVLDGFVRKMCQHDAFLASVRDLLAHIMPAATSNGIAQCALKLCAPGVPDTFQGTELWDHSLVDPDNRRPVDYSLRRRLLAEDACRLEDGSAKLFVTRRLLALRREHPELFARGTYLPIDAGKHVIAFAREHAGARLFIAARRFASSGGVELPKEEGVEVLAGAPIALPVVVQLRA